MEESMGSSVKNKRIAIAAVAVVVVALIAVLVLTRGVEDFHDKYAGADLSVDVAGMEREDTYTGYLNDHAGAAHPAQSAEVDLYDYEAEGGVEVYNDFEGEDKALFTDTDSMVTWKVNVPETGFYNICMEYLLPESRGVAAERVVYVNGEIPFGDARNISFSRIWTDAADPTVDNQGNEIRPSQVEVYDWQRAYFKDDMGYITDPYVFYLEKGENTIGLEAANEPMVLRRLDIVPVQEIATYEEYLANQPADTASGAAKDYMALIEGEDSTYRSESSLYAKYDRSSPTTRPTVLPRLCSTMWAVRHGAARASGSNGTLKCLRTDITIS